MKIELKKITVSELTNGFKDNDENGVVGYGGKLDIRPPYQREFISPTQYSMRKHGDGGFPLFSCPFHARIAPWNIYGKPTVSTTLATISLYPQSTERRY